MAARTYTATEVIALPRLSASAAAGVGEALATAAKPHKKELQKGVAKALSRLTEATAAVAVALRDQAGPTLADDSPALRKLDQNLDNGWSGLNDFLTAFTKLQGRPEAAEALSLQKTIFDKKLAFLTIAYRLEWAESQSRIDRIAHHALDKRLAKLGGQMFLDAIHAAQAAYGDALGLTAAKKAAPEAVSALRDPLDAFGEALRYYVAKVIGSVEHDDPATQELADALLEPLASWNVTASRPAAAGDAIDEPTDPAPPATPVG